MWTDLHVCGLIAIIQGKMAKDLEYILSDNFCEKCRKKVKILELEHGVRVCSNCGFNLEVLSKEFLRKFFENG